MKRIVFPLLGCVAALVLGVFQFTPHTPEYIEPTPAPPTAKIYAPTETPKATPAPLPLPGEVTYLYFSQTGSYRKRVEYYEFYAENGTYTAYFRIAYEEEPYPMAVDQAWVDTLTEIVYKNNMLLWDGFKANSYDLLDADSFDLQITFSDGTAVSACGYGLVPSGFGSASGEIDTHFMQLLPEDMRDW